MKIEIVVLFGIIYVSAAVEFNITTTANPVTKPKGPKFETIYYNATASQAECSLTVLKFPGAYLRGAKYPNLITYNNISNFKSCQKLCCYEKSFECKSLSFFRPLRQCFVMNLTRHDKGVSLTQVANMVHVQTLTEYDLMTTASPDEETTEMSVNSTTQATTIGGRPADGGAAKPTPSTGSVNLPSEQSTTKSVKDGSNSDGSEKENPTGVFNVAGPASSEKLIARDCAVNCSNNGRCLRKNVDDSADDGYNCECSNGFTGKYCETQVTEEGGLAVWIIVVIVIGVLILILIIVACVLLKLYKKKGEYRVVDYFRRWTRRQKKPSKPDNPNEIAHMEDSNGPFPPNGTSHGLHEDSTRTAV